MKITDLDYEVWTCKDRRRIIVTQMDDNHLVKSVLRIKFSPELWRVNYLQRLEREMRDRNLTMEAFFDGQSDNDK